MKQYLTLFVSLYWVTTLAQTKPLSLNDVSKSQMEIMSFRLPSKMQWADTTIRFCAYRAANGSSTMLPWFFENSTYTNSQLTDHYISAYVSNNIYYNRESYLYHSNNDVERTDYSSPDSINWYVDQKTRTITHNSNSLDTTANYIWNAGMNQWLQQSLTSTYKSNNIIDSIKITELGTLSSKTTYYRNNNQLDSIVQYNYSNGQWTPINWEIFVNVNYSISQSLNYNAIKRYRDLDGNVIAILNYTASGQLADSTHYYITNSNLDSTVTFDSNLNYLSSEGIRYDGSVEKRYVWNNLMNIIRYQYLYFNLQDEYIGTENFNSSGQLTSKVGICEVFNSLEDELNIKKSTIIYPNPNNGVFYISLDDVQVDNIVVSNSHGQIIDEFKPAQYGSSINIELNQKQSGIYWVTIYSKNNIKSLPVYVID